MLVSKQNKKSINSGYPPNLLLQKSSLNKGGKNDHESTQQSAHFSPFVRRTPLEKAVRGMNYLHFDKLASFRIIKF